jgi:hypothetical protein
MKGSTRAAVALGVGYMLGRQRKLRTATVMAVATAVGGTSVSGLAMRRGAKMLADSGVMDKVPAQVGDLVDTVRGDLLLAGKGAATAVVTSRIDALTDSLHDRAERLRNPAEAAAEATEAAGKAAGGAARGTAKAGRGAAGAAGSATRRLHGRGPAEDAADEPADDEAYADEVADDEVADDEEGYSEDEYAEDDYDEAEPKDEPEKRHVPAPRARGRGPVTRTRR